MLVKLVLISDTYCILGQETSIMLSDFHFLVPESFHTKFGKDLRKSSLKFIMYTTFNTHISRCLLPLTFRSLAEIVSEKSTVFTFFL